MRKRRKNLPNVFCSIEMCVKNCNRLVKRRSLFLSSRIEHWTMEFWKSLMLQQTREHTDPHQRPNSIRMKWKLSSLSSTIRPPWRKAKINKLNCVGRCAACAEWDFFSSQQNKNPLISLWIAARQCDAIAKISHATESWMQQEKMCLSSFLQMIATRKSPAHKPPCCG